mgnify:CR=1 FL=1
MSQYWKVLKTDRVVGESLPNTLQISYRKSKSLRDELVHSYTDPRSHITWLMGQKGFKTCGKCKACKNSKNVKEYGTTFGKKCYINKDLTCTSDFCIYVLQCPCGLKYVGSTIFQIKKRVLEHYRAIFNKDFNYPVAKHFYDCHNSDAKLLSFFAIDRVERSLRGGDREKRLRKLESRHILQIGIKYPLGLNKDEEMASHL